MPTVKIYFAQHVLHFLLIAVLPPIMYLCGCSCPDGKTEGQCGLKGKCVECNRDDDCPSSMGCLPWGECSSSAHIQCYSDTDCWMTYNDSRFVCSTNTCVLPCEADSDCYYGSKCRLGECYNEWCPGEGGCPDQWRDIEGSLYCRFDGDCHDRGMILGACGLNGMCVECFSDEHCPSGICKSDGNCIEPECFSNAECQNGASCVESRCAIPCLSDVDCGEDIICDSNSKHCRHVRCDISASCENWGWQSVSGSLNCHYDPCPGSSLVPGVCGLERMCIQCITDENCGAGEYCALYGECLDYPNCDPDAHRYCFSGETCVDGRCHLSCENDDDCLWGAGICMPEGYCYFERCSPEGTCPAGWAPGDGSSAPGSLACVKIR